MLKCQQLIQGKNNWFLLFKPEISIDFGYFCIYQQLEFHAKLSWAWKNFYNGCGVDFGGGGL